MHKPSGKASFILFFCNQSSFIPLVPHKASLMHGPSQQQLGPTNWNRIRCSYLPCSWVTATWAPRVQAPHAVTQLHGGQLQRSLVLNFLHRCTATGHSVCCPAVFGSHPKFFSKKDECMHGVLNKIYLQNLYIVVCNFSR